MVITLSMLEHLTEDTPTRHHTHTNPVLALYDRNLESFSNEKENSSDDVQVSTAGATDEMIYGQDPTLGG